MSRSKRLVVFSGAGLSADSGIPTFRSEDGTWANHNVDQVCNIYRWKQNFELVHRFYNDRRLALARAEPNAMHHLLVRWQERYDAELITQNVDDLLERAGARNVLHVHGFLTEQMCQACGRSWSIGHRAWDPEVERCSCNSRKGVKPNVVFFGETAPAYRPMWKALSSLGPRDMLVVIGTDGAVIPIGAIAAEIPCHKLLNTLAPVPRDKWLPGMVSPALFHNSIFRPAAEAVDEIDAIVTSWMDAAANPEHDT